MNAGTAIHVSLRMNCNIFSDPLIFPIIRSPVISRLTFDSYNITDPVCWQEGISGLQEA